MSPPTNPFHRLRFIISKIKNRGHPKFPSKQHGGYYQFFIENDIKYIHDTRVEFNKDKPDPDSYILKIPKSKESIESIVYKTAEQEKKAVLDKTTSDRIGNPTTVENETQLAFEYSAEEPVDKKNELQDEKYIGNRTGNESAYGKKMDVSTPITAKASQEESVVDEHDVEDIITGAIGDDTIYDLEVMDRKKKSVTLDAMKRTEEAIITYMEQNPFIAKNIYGDIPEIRKDFYLITLYDKSDSNDEPKRIYQLFFNLKNNWIMSDMEGQPVTFPSPEGLSDFVIAQLKKKFQTNGTHSTVE